MNTEQFNKSTYLKDLRESVMACEAMRKDPENPQDITLAEYVQARWQVSLEAFYGDLGVDPGIDTIENIVNMPNPDLRWILPEIYRDAIRLGMRTAPIYSNLIITEQSVKGLNIIQPAINMSDATPLYTGIAETIRLGDVSFDQKQVQLRKLARGIKIPYELRNFVSLNVVSIFLQDFGVKLGQGIDSMAISTLLNGDQADGSDATAVIGVDTPYTTPPPAGGLAYRDLLRAYIRMARLGKRPNVMIGGEAMALDILDLPEFKLRQNSGPTEATLNIKTPIPNRSDFYIHSAIPDDQVLILDPRQAMIKYNAQSLLVESEKIVSNQTEATYASLITGFGTIFQDARLAIDRTEDFATNGFPTWMDPIAAENVTFTK